MFFLCLTILSMNVRNRLISLYFPLFHLSLAHIQIIARRFTLQKSRWKSSIDVLSWVCDGGAINKSLHIQKTYIPIFDFVFWNLQSVKTLTWLVVRGCVCVKVVEWFVHLHIRDVKKWTQAIRCAVESSIAHPAFLSTWVCVWCVRCVEFESQPLAVKILSFYSDSHSLSNRTSSK